LKITGRKFRNLAEARDFLMRLNPTPAPGEWVEVKIETLWDKVKRFFDRR